MAEIDSLTIRIQAETGSAVAQLKQILKLVEQLNTVANDKGWKSFTNGISRLGKASENVEKLASALKGLQNMQVSPNLKKNFEKITTATDSLAGATKNISRFNSALKRLSKTGAESDQMEQTYGKLTTLLKGMSQALGQTNFQTIADGLKNFASAMGRIKKLGEDADLGKKFSSVAQTVGVFANRLNSAVSDEVLARLERIATALKDIAQSANAAGRAAKKFEKANDEQKTAGVKSFAKAWQTVIKAVESVNKVLSDMGRELYSALDSTGIISDLDGMSGAIAKNIPVLAELTSAWKSAASQIRSIVLSNASIVDKAANVMLVRVSTLVKTLYSLAKLPISNIAMSSTKGIIGLIGAPLKNLANNVTDITKRWNKFVSSLSRIAIYRLIRTALKEISKAMKEGIQNLYLWGQAWRDTYSSAAKFVDTMDKLATAFLYLKNSIGAMVSPLLDMVAPVIDSLIDKFVALTNAINQAIAALSGAGVWRRALKYQYTYAEAANLTTKALKRTVLAFDELNKLDDKSGSGKNDNLDYSKMFEEVPVSDGLAKILESTSWRILGTTIANKINETLASIDWNSVKSGARIWARRFGSFLDGMFMGISMPLLGKSIAEGLNTIALSINSFFKEFHFRELGQNLATGFTSLINNLKWDEIGQALTQKWKALFELIIGFKDVDLTGLGSGIATMFVNAIENLPISELVDAVKTILPKIGRELGVAIGGIIKQTNKTIGGIDAQGLGSSFSLAIENMLKGIDAKEAGIFLSNGIKKIIEFATGALKTLPFEEMKSWLSTMITSVFENIDLKQGVQNAIDIATKIVELLTTTINAIPWEEVGSAIEESDTSELKNGIKGLFESVVNALERSGFMDEIATGVASFFGLKLAGALAKAIPTIITTKSITSAITSGMSAGGAASGGGLLGSILGGLGIGAGGATAGAMLGQQFSHHVLGPILEGFGSADADLYKNWTFFGEGGLFQASLDNAKFNIEGFSTNFNNWAYNFGLTHRGVVDNVTSGNTLLGDGFNLLTSLIQGDSEGIDTSISNIKDKFTLWGDTWATEHPLISAGFDAIQQTVQNSTIASLWSDAMGSIELSTDSVLTFIEEKFGTAFDFITGGIKSLISGADDVANTLGKGARNASNASGKITMRASGGMVDKGDLFIAGESGPELVTSYGGESAVMNMDQIIASIAGSVAMASGGDTTIPIYLDGGLLDKVIVTAQQRQSLRSGR